MTDTTQDLERRLQEQLAVNEALREEMKVLKVEHDRLKHLFNNMLHTQPLYVWQD